MYFLKLLIIWFERASEWKLNNERENEMNEWIIPDNTAVKINLN